MLLVAAFKELIASQVSALRELWRRGGRPLHVGVAVGLLLLAAALGISQWHQAMREAPPAWLRLQKWAGPPLPAGTWNLYREMLRQAQSYSNQWQVPIGSVRLLVLQPDLTNAVLWTTDTFVNPGFDALRSWERSFGGMAGQFIGYYSREGRPLTVTVKHSPSRPRDLLLTVQLEKPVAPGAAEILLRCERQPSRLQQRGQQERHLGLGRLPEAGRAIHLSGVVLPANARLVRFTPEQGASVKTNGGVFVSWVNARLGTSAPPLSVVFTTP